VSAEKTRIDVRVVSVEIVRPLRHKVLRPGRPESTVYVPIDDDPRTWHLAAYDADDVVVGVVTFFPEAYPALPGRSAERFRWMAVEPGLQGRGIGRLLMRRAAELLAQRDVEVMWAHGRDSALGFYQLLGFRVEGEGFIDPDTGIGHHYVVIDVADLTR
jgi:GNAT superfamily N-acetyltransferase